MICKKCGKECEGITVRAGTNFLLSNHVTISNCCNAEVYENTSKRTITEFTPSEMKHEYIMRAWWYVELPIYSAEQGCFIGKKKVWTQVKYYDPDKKRYSFNPLLNLDMPYPWWSKELLIKNVAWAEFPPEGV